MLSPNISREMGSGANAFSLASWHTSISGERGFGSVELPNYRVDSREAWINVWWRAKKSCLLVIPIGWVASDTNACLGATLYCENLTCEYNKLSRILRSFTVSLSHFHRACLIIIVSDSAIEFHHHLASTLVIVYWEIKRELKEQPIYIQRPDKSQLAKSTYVEDRKSVV